MSTVMMKYDVAIAGAGIAAGAISIRLLGFGIRPVLIRCSRPSYHAAEAIPETALPLFKELGLETALRRAGGLPVEEFEVRWGRRGFFQKRGWHVHVDRAELAKAVLAEAVGRGAALINCERLSPLKFEDGVIRCALDGGSYEFTWAVDATGRAAVWSRPVCRAGRRVADLFHIRATAGRPRAMVSALARGWAYRIDLPDYITVGVVNAPRTTVRCLDPDVAEALKLPPGEATYVVRRPAFPQWSLKPVRRCALAVGDAALAHDPFSGQGIRFALASALAGAAVVRTWRDMPENSPWAESYYDDLVSSERARHASALARLYRDATRAFVEDATPASGAEQTFSAAEPPVPLGDLPSAVRFAGQVRIAGVLSHGLILPEEVVELSDGTTVRWLGGFDLLLLKEFALLPTSLSTLREWLRERLSVENATRLIAWCLARGVLIEATL